jgi:cytochrome c-type biogenesis protein CcmH
MTIWIVFAVITAAVLILLLRPLMGRAPATAPRAAYDLAIHRDQLAEIVRDRARGVLTEAEAASARLEVERRLLAAAPKADRAMPEDARAARPVPAMALALILFVPVAAVGIYALLGHPDLPDAPLAGRGVERQFLADDGNLDMQKVQGLLRQRLAQDPSSLQGWVLLARADDTLRDWAGAKDAWQHALALSHDRPDMLSGYAEMLVGEAQGTVSREAAEAFRKALAADPKAYAARYYLALGKAQSGDAAGAVADWQALLKDAPANSPWRGQVQQTIAEAEQAKTAAPGATPTSPAEGGAPPAGAEAALMSLPPDQRLQAIQGMVEGLAARLQANPNDLAGWKRLARSYLVLNQPAKAADAFAEAIRLDGKDPDLLVGRADALRVAANGNGDAGAAMPPESLSLYRQALLLDPKAPEALWFLGLTASRAHDVKAAAGYWTVLLGELDPNSQDYLQVKQALDGLGKS